MAWIGAHFSIGLACTGAVTAGVCAVRGKGFKAVPVAMLAGGVLAVAPDLPHTLRQDMPDSMLTGLLGAKALTQWLHAHGDWFFFHNWLDARYEAPWGETRLGLRGLALLVIAYNIMTIALFRAYDRKAAQAANLKAHLVSQRRDIQLDRVPDESRRSEHRIPYDRPIHAIAAIGRDRQPQTLADAALIDVCEDGMAIESSTPVGSGSTVYVKAGDDVDPVQAIVLEEMRHADRFRLRCRRIGDQSPTCLLKAA